MWEHTAYCGTILIGLVFYIVVLACPYWAISTKTNQFTITSDLTVYVGFFQQCQNSQWSSKPTCRDYAISQTSLPAYFNFSRWSVGLSGILVLIALIMSLVAHPMTCKGTISPSDKFGIRLAIAGLLMVAGAFTVAAGSWWSYACYTNQLGPLIGPGSTTLIPNVSSYTPFWCCVVGIFNGCVIFITGIIMSIRACIIQYSVEMPTRAAEIYAINEALKEEDSAPRYSYIHKPVTERTAQWAYENRVYC